MRRKGHIRVESQGSNTAPIALSVARQVVLALFASQFAGILGDSSALILFYAGGAVHVAFFHRRALPIALSTSFDTSWLVRVASAALSVVGITMRSAVG